MNFLDERVPSRIWDKAIPEPMSGCWLWNGAGAAAGHPVAYINRTNRSVARLIFELLRIEIPESQSIYRRCDVDVCINPQHLALRTQRQRRIDTNADPSWRERLFSKVVERPSGCHEFVGFINQDGYGILAFKKTKGGKRLQRLAHRVAWTIANGAIPCGAIVMHSCDNRRCCNIEHLSIGTVADNNRDRAMKGRSALCSRCRQAIANERRDAGGVA